MTQEQARQEAERRVEEFSDLVLIRQEYDIKCALISINREIELLEEIQRQYDNGYFEQKLNDLNQIKDELLKM